MKTYILPAGLAVLVFAAGMVSAAGEFTSSGTLSLVTAALLIAAVSLGVLAQRIYLMSRELDSLRERVATLESYFEQDDGQGGQDGGEPEE
jgi:hypothetical protein